MMKRVITMARLDIAVDHGQTPAEARVNFERAVLAAQDRYAAWIHRLEWSTDRTAVMVAGSACRRSSLLNPLGAGAYQSEKVRPTCLWPCWLRPCIAARIEVALVVLISFPQQ